MPTRRRRPPISESGETIDEGRELESDFVSRSSCYTIFVRNVTITLDEETARWIRLEAAAKNSSVSRLVGEMLRERMVAEHSYQAAMEKYLEREPSGLRAAGRLPSREEVHDRPGIR
jgi:hypothetical protein